MQIAATVKRLAAKVARDGFFHIVGAGFVNKALSLLMGVALVRILSKFDYGVYAYAFNIASFFILFNGLGATSAIIQICSELNKDSVTSDIVYAFGYKAGVLVDAAMAATIAGTALIVPLAIEGSNYILLLYCVYPLLLLLCDIKLTYLRVHLRNDEYAFMTNVQTVFNVSLALVGALFFQVSGLVIGQCLACVFAWVVMCVRNPQFDVFRLPSPSRNQRIDYWKLALVSAFNNAIGQALTLIGTFLVGFLLVDGVLVAEYKIATTLPFALLFLPSMVVTYIYPHFAMHKDDQAWTLRNYGRLIAASVIGMGITALLMAAFADPIIVVVFGEQYAEVAPVLRVLMVGFFITAAFRQPTGNLLITQRRLGYNTFVGIVSIAFNIAASYLLIPDLGMMGAAMVYDATMALGALLNVSYYLHVVRRIEK